jgi:hypothetical protein
MTGQDLTLINDNETLNPYTHWNDSPLKKNPEAKMLKTFSIWPHALLFQVYQPN